MGVFNAKVGLGDQYNLHRPVYARLKEHPMRRPLRLRRESPTEDREHSYTDAGLGYHAMLSPVMKLTTVVPVMNGHPRDQAKVSVHCRWPLIRGNLTLKCVGRGIDNVAVQGRWPLTTGVAQGRYYCTPSQISH